MLFVLEDLSRVGTLHALDFGVDHFVPLLELAEGDALKRIRMEEEVLLRAIPLDEAGFAVAQLGNLAALHNVMNLPCFISRVKIRTHAAYGPDVLCG